MLKKLLGDKYSRANNIAKSVRSLQRVPEKERPRIVKEGSFQYLRDRFYYYPYLSVALFFWK